MIKKSKKVKITNKEKNLLMWPPSITNPLWEEYVKACEKVGIEPGSCRWKMKNGTTIPIVFPKDGTKWVEIEEFNQQTGA